VAPGGPSPAKMGAAWSMVIDVKRRWALLVSATAGAGFCFLAMLVAGGKTVLFDSAIRAAVHASTTPSLTLVETTFSVLGRVFVLIPATGVIALYLLIGRRSTAGIACLITMAGALMVNWALKAAVHRPRPLPFYGLDPDSFSFPSGHVFFSTCFCVAMLLSLFRPNKLSLGLSTAFVVAVAWSRVYLGVHYPTDVIAGLLAGLCWMGALFGSGLFGSGKISE
jgi:membrane-associated phospholipid phosphatase